MEVENAEESIDEDDPTEVISEEEENCSNCFVLKAALDTDVQDQSNENSTAISTSEEKLKSTDIRILIDEKQISSTYLMRNSN